MPWLDGPWADKALPTIDSFRGEYAFLSNFHPIQIEFEGLIYPTVEHAFQAAKVLDTDERLRIQLAETPNEAKRIGRWVALRDDWEDVKVSIMEGLLRDKFHDESLQRLLVSTGKAELIEGNTWGDSFWGVSRGWGDNVLGKLLMKIRAEYQAS